MYTFVCFSIYIYIHLGSGFLGLPSMPSSVDDVSEHLLASPSSYSMDALSSRYHDTNEEQPLQIKIGTSLNSVFRRQGRNFPGTRFSRPLFKWAQGPRSPRPFKIKPLPPQVAHLGLLERFLPGKRKKSWLLVVFYLLWLDIFIVVLAVSLSHCQVPGYGAPVRLSCVSRSW